jgi:ferritin-like metal-binding protein YciE
LFLHQLKDTYYAENAIIKALGKMGEAAQSDELRGAFGVHAEESREQVKRLDQVFKLLGERPEGVTCKAIEGIIAEAKRSWRIRRRDANDAALISAAQAIEHYESTRTAPCCMAKQLGMDEAADLLKETLVEE